MRFDPVAYDHAAILIGKTPWEVSRDPDLLFEALKASVERYQLDECVVGIDIYNIEAEACGCVVNEPNGDDSPTISESVFQMGSKITGVEYNPERDGRSPMILSVGERLKDSFPDLDAHVPLCGPFTLAAHLVGIENLVCDLFTDPDEVVSGLEHLASLQVIYAKAAMKRGLNLTFFESMVTPPLLSPELFRERIAPVIKTLFDEVASDGASRPRLIIGGDTLSILDGVLSCGPSYIICPIETDQEGFVEKVVDESIFVRVNLKPSVFIGENSDAALDEAKRALSIAKKRGKTSVGTILPTHASPRIVDSVSGLLRAD